MPNPRPDTIDYLPEPPHVCDICHRPIWGEGVNHLTGMRMWSHVDGRDEDHEAVFAYSNTPEKVAALLADLAEKRIMREVWELAHPSVHQQLDTALSEVSRLTAELEALRRAMKEALNFLKEVRPCGDVDWPLGNEMDAFRKRMKKGESK